jgi:hypothetical protein
VKTRQMVVSLSVVLMLGALLTANFQKQPAPAAAMAEAANAFSTTLTDAQRDLASFSFDDAERLNWHYIPRERKGLPIRDLEGDALKTGLALLRSGLSEVGYDQALNVMSLEELLYLLEGGTRKERRSKRDPKKYYISIFGKPGNKGSWAWRIEGHHLSLNYTIVDGELVSTTPEFFGANPGFVDAGPGREIRVLGAEEDIARQILKQCTPDQVKKCWLSKDAPDDIRSRGTTQPDTSAAVGLAVKDMSADQKKLMSDLLTEYLQNMPADVASERRKQINEGGKNNIHFAWWGDSEYNNTQNSANHVHAIWRNIDGDFNLPAK